MLNVVILHVKLAKINMRHFEKIEKIQKKLDKKTYILTNKTNKLEDTLVKGTVTRGQSALQYCSFYTSCFSIPRVS